MIKRYTLPRMGAIWEPQNRFQKWLEVEICVCEAMAREGMIPAQAVETIKKRAAFSVERIDEIEIPFLGVIPADDTLTNFEFSGKPLIELSLDSPVYQAAAEMMDKTLNL